MGCCFAPRKENLEKGIIGSNQTPIITTLYHPDDSIDPFIPTVGSIHRSAYKDPNINMSPLHEDMNNSLQQSLSIFKIPSGVEITIKVLYIDYFCNNFIQFFQSDFHPELVITFEDRTYTFVKDKPHKDIAVDDEYMTRAGHFATSKGGSTRNTKRAISISEASQGKKIARIEFEGQEAVLPEISVESIIKGIKNAYISFSIFQRSRGDDLCPGQGPYFSTNNVGKKSQDKLSSRNENLTMSNAESSFMNKTTPKNFEVYQKVNSSMLVAESHVPVSFLLTLPEIKNEIEVQMYNFLDDLYIGNLVIQAEVVCQDRDDNKEAMKLLFDRKNLYSTKSETVLPFLIDYLKYNILTLNDYGSAILEGFSRGPSEDLFFENLRIKTSIYAFIDKYANGEKEQAKALLLSYITIDKDTSTTPDHINSSVIQENVNDCSSCSSLSRTKTTPCNTSKKGINIDFKSLNHLRYFIFISRLNEILMKPELNELCEKLDQLKFFHEKMIFCPYDTRADSPRLSFVLILDTALSFMLNLKRISGHIFDDRFDLKYIIHFNDFIKNVRKRVQSILEKDSKDKNPIRMLPYENERSFKPFGPVSCEHYLLCRNCIYKFLKWVRYSLDLKFDHLKNKKLNLPAQLVDNLKTRTKSDLECFKLGMLNFLLTTREGDRELLYLRDINITLGILNIIKSYVKLGSEYSKIVSIEREDVFISNLLSHDSPFLKWIALTLKVFYLNPRYIAILNEIIYELFLKIETIFIFNFFRRVDLLLFFKSFCKYISKCFSSKKLTTIFYFCFNISRTVRIIKPSLLSNFDFIELNWSLILKHILGVYHVIDRNMHFDIHQTFDLSLLVEKENMYYFTFFYKHKHVKFFQGTAPVIMSTLFQIFASLSLRDELVKELVQRRDGILNKIIGQILFFAYARYDGFIKDLMKQNTKAFSDFFSSSMTFLQNIQHRINFDIVLGKALCFLMKNDSPIEMHIDFNQLINQCEQRIKNLKSYEENANNKLKIIEKPKTIK